MPLRAETRPEPFEVNYERAQTRVVPRTFRRLLLKRKPRRWKEGFEDGYNDQPVELKIGEVEHSAEAHVLKQIEEAERRLVRLKARLARAESLRTALEARKQRAETVYDELSDYVRKNADRLGFALAWLCLLLSAVLIVSDMPLTLTLVADGFSLPTQATVLVDGQAVTVGIDQLFSRPGLVVAALWQTMSLALGIACVPLFLDIPFQTWLSTQESAPLRKGQRIGLTAIAMLLFATIGVLGHFRAESRQANLTAAAEERAMEFARLLGIYGGHAPPARAASATIPPLLTDLAFICLTLLLPIVGAIFFSTGRHRISVYIRLAHARLALAWLESHYHRTLARSIASRQQVQVIEMHKLPALTSPAHLRAEIEMEMALYRQGHFRGSCSR
jgi:hypothetical protein